jgi:hypothetical protein
MVPDVVEKRGITEVLGHPSVHLLGEPDMGRRGSA